MGPPSSLPPTTSTDATEGSAVSYGSPFVLPMDILFLVFMECDIYTLVTCRLICRGFDVFIKNQRTLLYKLALALEHQVDSSWSGAPSTPSLTSLQKLQRLRRQSLAWRGELPSALKVKIPVTRPDSIYELNGGIFTLGDTNGREDGDQIVAFPGMDPPQGSLGARLDFVKLPSVISGNLGVEWGHIPLGRGIKVVDFTMNVDMDLLILIEKKPVDSIPSQYQYLYRVHLMSLSRSTTELEPHPLAHSAVLEYPCHPDWSEYSIEFSIYGDHAGLVMNSAQSSLFDTIVVWNWKDGTKAAKHGEDEILETFVFLQEGVVVIPSYNPASICIYTYTPSADVGTFQPILSLPLPAASVGLDYLYILVRSQATGHPTISKPVTTATKPGASFAATAVDLAEESTDPHLYPPSTSGPFKSISVPFSPAIDDAIIVVSMRITPIAGPSGDSWAERMLPDSEGTLVIKKSTLWGWIRYWEERNLPNPVDPNSVDGKKTAAESAFPGNRPSGAALHRSQGVQTSPEPSSSPDMSLMKIPWYLWMYETRWLRDKEAPRWVRDVHGMRFATRVKEAPPPTIPASYNNPPAGAYQSGAVGTLPSMQQLWSAESAASAEVTLPATTEPSVTVNSQTQLPSISGLLLQQEPPSPITLTQDLPQQVDIPSNTERYRTRICDFNLKPYIRVPSAVPYPGNVQLDLSIDYGELGGTDESGPMSDSQTEARAHIQRYQSYLKKKGKADGRLTTDRGWSVIQPEKGLEWTRRPVWEDTVIQPGITYAEKICTGLPYLEITGTVCNERISLMMDAERIIGMKTDDALNLTSLEVLVI